MNHNLKSIHVKRFKNIEDAAFEAGDVNVFVGSNNSGKSTLAQMLHFGVSILQAIELANKWGKKPDKTVSLSPADLLYSPCVDLYSLGHGGRLTEDKKKAIELNMVLTNDEKIRITIQKGRNGNILVNVENVPEAKKISNIEMPYTIYSPGLAGIARNESLVSTGVLLRTIARGDANLVLRNILYRLSNRKDQNDWHNFLEDLKEIFPNIKLSVQYNESTDEHILVYADTGTGRVPIELAGTGVLQAIQILGYVHYFHPSVIILDEPDSHLHPNNQRLLCSLLQDVAENRDTQLFLTTHSRHVIDALNGVARFLWVHSGRVKEVKDGFDIAILLDLGALDVNEILTQTNNVKCVVLTEDKNTRALKALLQASHFVINDNTTIVLSYFGCTTPHNLRPLLTVIRESNPKAKIIVHRDRDYMNDSEATKWETDIRKMSVEPFLTKGTDIESHFLNAKHLAELNEKNEEDIALLIEQATKDTRELSIQKYVNGRTDIAKKSGTFGALNVGQLAVEAPKIVDGDPERYRYAKKVLSNLRKLYREKYGTNLKVYEPSEHILVDELYKIARKIYGEV